MRPNINATNGTELYAKSEKGKTSFSLFRIKSCKRYLRPMYERKRTINPIAGSRKNLLTVKVKQMKRIYFRFDAKYERNDVDRRWMYGRLYREYFKEAIYDRETRRGRKSTKKSQKRRDEENTNERRRITEEKEKSLLFAADLRNEIEALVTR